MVLAPAEQLLDGFFERIEAEAELEAEAEEEKK